jgi:hypothetical protein
MSEAAEAEDVVDAVDATDVVDETLPDVTERAHNMGWTPKEQFKGDPEKWVDAAEFVRRGEEFVPFLKANNKALERQIKDLTKTVKNLADHNAKTDERAYARALKDLKAEQAAAVAAGDVDAVDQITDEIAALATAKAAKPSESDDFGETFAAWKAENKWYDSDPALQEAAFGIAEKLRQEGKTPAEQLPLVATRIKQLFPEKFENPRRREAGAVEGGSTARRSGSKGYSDLPADAKAMCDDFVKRGILTREKYIKDFFTE